MKFHARKQVPLGPIRLHFTEHGFSSWSVKLGPATWNSRRGWTVDTPGPGHLRQSKRKH